MTSAVQRAPMLVVVVVGGEGLLPPTHPSTHSQISVGPATAPLSVSYTSVRNDASRPN